MHRICIFSANYHAIPKIFFSAHINFQILGFFRFRPLKTQKVHYLNSGIPVHGICIFSANQQAIPTFFLSADRNFEILGFFPFRPPKNTKGQRFDFWYPCAWNLHIFS